MDEATLELVWCIEFLAAVIAMVVACHVARKKYYREGLRPYNHRLVFAVALIWWFSIVIAYVIWLFRSDLAMELATIVETLFIVFGIVEMYEELRSEEPGDPGPYWF